MGQKSRVLSMCVNAIFDFIINLVAVYATIVALREIESFIYGKTIMAVATVVTMFSIIAYFVFDIYSLKRFERLHRKLFRLTLAQLVLMTLAVITVSIFSPERENYILILVCVALSYVLLLVKTSIATKLLHRVRTKNAKDIIIIGDGNGAEEYERQLEENQHYGYRVIGCVNDSDKLELEKLGGYDQLDEILKKYNPYEVVIALDSSEESKMNKIMAVCDANGIRTAIIPITYKYFRAKCQVDMVGNVPIINTRTIPLDNLANAAIKRAMDIIISLIVIILTSPIMLIAAIGVRLSSKGPIIFKQKRVGKNNVEFTMYKFRSMKVNSEESTAWTTDDDPRKTKFGTFMRKTGIDELPQFFNVLFGSMSIIGPRPELPKFVEEYSQTIPLYKVKHQVKPGITGLAQIYGFRGNTSIERRIELDIKYIEEWSVFNDLKILVMTPFKMFNRNEKYVG